MTAEQYTGLPLDEEIDAVIAVALDPTTDGATFTRPAVASEDGARFAWGMGRALARLKARDDELVRQRQMLIREIEHPREQIASEIAFLEKQLEEMTLERRESGAGNFLDLPGVGRWKTRKVPAGWDIKDPAAVIEALNADERALYVEDMPKLKAADYRAHLDETGEVPPGVERRPERISVSYTLNGAS